MGLPNFNIKNIINMEYILQAAQKGRGPTPTTYCNSPKVIS